MDTPMTFPSIRLRASREALQDALADHRVALREHSLHLKLTNELHARIFLEAHVWPAWALRRLGEALGGEAAEREILRFENYLARMSAAGASRAEIDTFRQRLTGGAPLETALPLAPHFVRAFLRFALRLAAGGEKHEIAAALHFGAENFAPSLWPEADSRGADFLTVDADSPQLWRELFWAADRVLLFRLAILDATELSLGEMERRFMSTESQCSPKELALS